MKIIRFLYLKYALSFLVCLCSSFVVFFIFSLVSNLNEDYLFNTILNLSILNSLQILTYVPSFIFLISLVLFSVFLRSRNEIIIIKSYLSKNKFIIFIIPIVMFYSIFEIYKKDLSLYLKNNKLNLIQIINKSEDKIIINEFNNNKIFTILKNIDLNNLKDTEYRSYTISNEQIKMAEFSNKLMFSDDALILKNYTEYKNNALKEYNIQKVIYIDLINLMKKNSLVKNISDKRDLKLDIRLINLFIFFIFFLSYIFLNFFNKKYLSTKQSLRNPVLISLILLIYSFLIFNNSLGAFKQVFELLASIIMFMLFFKAYLNE